MKKHSFRERFSYWFDNKMSGGLLGLIKFLAIVTVCVIVLIAVVLFILSGAEDRDIGSSLWDSMATVINAWMPSYEDGGPAYLILMAVSAVVGLFVTSVLIGIVSSAIEEKITSLRKGTSAVLEENHIDFRSADAEPTCRRGGRKHCHQSDRRFENAENAFLPSPT